MRKYLYLSLLTVCIALNAGAQSKESVFAKIANELCVDIKEKQNELSQAEDMEMELGLMMIPYFGKYESQIKKAIPGFDVSDPKDLENLGEEIGKKLISCPEFLSLIASKTSLKSTAAGEQASQSLQGTLQSVTPGEFTSFTVKTTSGKIEKIWWLEYFPGDTKLSDGSLLNQEVTVKYIEKEIYNATLKDYVKIKIATGIE